MRLHNRIFSFFIAFAILLPTLLSAQPKRELRGVWITTQYNLDWPSKPGLNSKQQKTELLEIYDGLKDLNFNAVFLQIRGAGDALYPSSLEPWSRALSGSEGQAPTPLYDPLKFAIEEARARGLEFHAWMNPFRVSVKKPEQRSFPTTHIYTEHPEWCLEYGGKVYLDPGIPAVRTYVLEVIAEVLRQYDIDALHFDDYFYPYPVYGTPFPDSISFATFNPDSMELGDWRRTNVNAFIEAVRDLILELQPETQFGVSPFGIWRNKALDPGGSQTRAGTSSYDQLYADVRYWAEEGFLDYVVPQIYFSTQYDIANYNILLDWWKENQGLADLYVGHAIYKVGNNADKQWDDPRELLIQIQESRKKAMGSIFFRHNFLRQNPLSVVDSLSKYPYAHPVLLPEIDVSNSLKPLFPLGFAGKSSRAGLSLNWDQKRSEGDYFAVYRSRGKEEVKPEQSPIHYLYHGKSNHWTDSTAKLFKKYNYQITHLNKYHQESTPSSLVSIRHRWGWKRWWKGLFKKG